MSATSRSIDTRTVEGTRVSGLDPRWSWLAASAALGLTVALAGCGGSGPAAPKAAPVSSPNVVLAAYTHTVGAKTAKVLINETVTEKTAGTSTKHVTISGTGLIDFTNHNGQLTLSAASTGTFTERFISPLLYIQLPAADRSQLTAGTSWAEINLNTLTEAKLGASLSQLSASSQESTQVLSYLQAVSSSGITTVGPATIGGVATTEYKATIDLTKVAAQKSPPARVALRAIEARLHTSTMPVQVWLDTQGRVCQIAYQLQESTIAAASPSSGTTVPAASGTVTSTIDYYDFGAAVFVSAPPAGQVDNITGQVVAAGVSTTTTGS
jgi:hypothetical protein